MNKALSQKFRFFTFICIALLAYVHGYNLNNTYLAPYSTVEEPLTVTSFFEYFIANGLLRFRIPMLFIISGYLYATYDHRPYLQQIQKRFKTLIIPFFLWSAAGLVLTFLLQQFTYTADVVYTAGIDQLGDNRPYTEIGWEGMLRRWLLHPVSYQLWFIVSLFIYNLIYPVIRWLVVKIPFIWLPLTFLLFFSLFQFIYVDGRGIFFFSLGIWLQKKKISIDRQPEWFSAGLAFILFIGLTVIKTFMAFELEPNQFSTSLTLVIFYQLSVITGIVAMWFGLDKVVRWALRKKWFYKASGFSFFLYGAHVPLLPYVMTMALMELSFLPYYRLFCYIVIPGLIVVLCIWLGRFVRKFLPAVYFTLTGSRGF